MLGKEQTNQEKHSECDENRDGEGDLKTSLLNSTQ